VSWYLEERLAPHLDVTKNVLEKFRADVLQKKDWRQTDRGIELSPPALQKLLEALGSPDLDCSACLATAAEPEPLELVVTRVFPNPQLLECAMTVNGAAAEKVRVRVPDNRNFRPRMTIKAVPDPVFPHLYKLKGRCPRFPGRW
jgi:hypothetical protein